MCLEQNADLIDEVEIHLDEADHAAALYDTRLTTGEVFGRARRRIQGRETIKEIDHETA